MRDYRQDEPVLWLVMMLLMLAAACLLCCAGCGHLEQAVRHERQAQFAAEVNKVIDARLDESLAVQFYRRVGENKLPIVGLVGALLGGGVLKGGGKAAKVLHALIERKDKP